MKKPIKIDLCFIHYTIKKKCRELGRAAYDDKSTEGVLRRSVKMTLIMRSLDEISQTYDIMPDSSEHRELEGKLKDLVDYVLRWYEHEELFGKYEGGDHA